MGMGMGRGIPFPTEGGVWRLERGSIIAYWNILGAILSATLLNSTGQRATSGVLESHGPLYQPTGDRDCRLSPLH